MPEPPDSLAATSPSACSVLVSLTDQSSVVPIAASRLSQLMASGDRMVTRPQLQLWHQEVWLRAERQNLGLFLTDQGSAAVIWSYSFPNPDLTTPPPLLGRGS